MAKPVKEAEAEGGLTRLGRVKHPVLGECVRVRLRAWEGPLYPGAKGRYAYDEVLAPRDQGRWGYGKLVGVCKDDGTPAGAVSSGVSYSEDLRRYGNFRWARS